MHSPYGSVFVSKQPLRLLYYQSLSQRTAVSKSSIIPSLTIRGSRTRKSCALCYVKDRMIDDVSRLHSPSYLNGTSRPARRHRRAHPDPLQSRPRRQRNQIQARLIFFSSAPDKLIHTSSSVQRSLLTSVYPTDQMSISSLLPSSLIVRTLSKW